MPATQLSATVTSNRTHVLLPVVLMLSRRVMVVSQQCLAKTKAGGSSCTFTDLSPVHRTRLFKILQRCHPNMLEVHNGIMQSK